MINYIMLMQVPVNVLLILVLLSAFKFSLKLSDYSDDYAIRKISWYIVEMIIISFALLIEIPFNVVSNVLQIPILDWSDIIISTVITIWQITILIRVLLMMKKRYFTVVKTAPNIEILQELLERLQRMRNK